MSTCETYGSKCPYCGYTRMDMRYGSLGWTQWEACPNCGFAYGESDEGCMKPEEVPEFWKDHIEIWRAMLESSKLPVSMEGIKMYLDSMPEQTDDISIKGIFNYSGDSPEEILARVQVKDCKKYG